MGERLQSCHVEALLLEEQKTPVENHRTAPWCPHNKEQTACEQPVYSPNSGSRSEVRAPAWSGEGPLPRLRLPESSVGRRGQGALWGLLYKTLIPLMRAPPSGPCHLPKAHLQTPSHWPLGFNRSVRVPLTTGTFVSLDSRSIFPHRKESLRRKHGRAYPVPAHRPPPPAQPQCIHGCTPNTRVRTILLGDQPGHQDSSRASRQQS